MTLKLNTFTGTWINEKLMRARHDAEARKQREELMLFKTFLIRKLWNDVDNLFPDSEGAIISINEDAAFMVDNIICDNHDLESMIEDVKNTVPDYEAQFVKHVYNGMNK